MKRLLALLLLLAAPAGALAPGEGVVVLFKDGSRLEGVLTELTRDSVELELGGARTTWRLDTVLRLEARRTAVEEFRDLERRAGEDPEKLARAARYARRHALYTYQRRVAALLGEPLPLPNAALWNPAPAPVEPPPPAQIPPLPPLGFGATPPQVSPPLPVGYYFPVLTAPLREPTDADRAAFLKRQAEKREEMRHRFVHPLEQFQFRLQEASDARALGLPFASKPL